MVSRSLEKMILIAVGLTTVVMVGVPVLLYSMNILTNASELEMAQNFAETVHNETRRVDTGLANHSSLEIAVPQHVTVSASGNTLVITYAKDGADTYLWSDTYSHPVSLEAPPTFGLHTFVISMEDGELVIAFVAHTI